MDFCDANGIDYVFGLSGNEVLRRLVEPVADDVRMRRAEANAAAIRPLHRDTLRRRGMSIGASLHGSRPVRKVSTSAMW
jgi:hypothetical protein